MEEYKSIIYTKLHENSSLEELINITRFYKNQGLSKDVAYNYLEEIRTQVNEDIEDRVLELMDFVSGFSAPEKRLWDK